MNVRAGLFEAGPLAFPHFDDVGPFGANAGHFVLGLLVNIVHGAVVKAQMVFVVNGITLGTTVPKTTMEFVHGVGLGMEAIDGERRSGHVVLASIAHVLNARTIGRMRMVGVGACHHVVSFQVVGKLIQGLTAEFVIAPVNHLMTTCDWLI